MEASSHIPVLADEILHWLNPRPGQIIVDGTLGGGGHTRLLAEKVGPSGYVVAFDRDPAALERAEETLQGLPVILAHANYSAMTDILAELKIPRVDGVLLDLGLSSDQLADDDRGFSFHSAGPLDLRMDDSSGEPAFRLLARLSSNHLEQILSKYGEEPYARRIAKAVVEARRQQPIRTAAQLAEIIRRATPPPKPDAIDPATLSFQALRIAVNDELAHLETVLAKLPECLKPAGRAAVISFHSLEDRRVKQAFRHDARWQVLTKKPVLPTEKEIHNNPRSRSSRLRVAQRAD